MNEASSPVGFAVLNWCREAGHWTPPAALTALLDSEQPARKARRKGGSRSSEAVLVDAATLVSEWLQTSDSATPLGLLACCELMRCSPSTVPPDVLDAVRSHLATHVLSRWEALASQEKPPFDPESEAPESPLGTIGDGLLLWAAGLILDLHPKASKLAKYGRQELQQVLQLATDEHGAPSAAMLRELPGWLALWTDAVLLGEQFERELWKDSLQKRWGGCVRYASTLLTASGRFLGCRATSSHESVLFRAVGTIDAEPDEAWLCSLRGDPPKIPSSKPSKASSKGDAEATPKVPLPGWESDDASLACLRSNWSNNSSAATVLFDRPVMSLHLSDGTSPLVDGDWTLEFQHAGEWITNSQPWDCVCWYSDEDVDFAEWSIEVRPGVKFARQLLLSRRDEYAILADLVTGAPTERVDLRTTWSLPADVTASPVDGTREFSLASANEAARLYPLVLPQDLRQSSSSHLASVSASSGTALQMTSVTGGNGVFSPVVLDWSRKRADQPCEWRTLTVTEVGVVDPAAGRGFRLQVGKLHLMLYRSLRPTSRYRSVLGHQAWHETVFAKVTRDGEISPILLVEM